MKKNKFHIPSTSVADSEENYGSRKKVGELRRAQIITTFGPGSIVDFQDYSCMVGAADLWKYEKKEIHNDNLMKVLGVQKLLESKLMDDTNGFDIPAFRFPVWYYCPHCHKLAPYRELTGSADDILCATCKTKIIPSRFVVACVNGHMDDFPYFQWVHRENHCPKETDDDRRQGIHHLEFHSNNRSGGLEGIEIQCSACGAKRSMKGCMNPKEMERYYCHGYRPWGEDISSRRHKYDQKGCHAKIRTLQRGASNIYYSVIKSALTIPRYNEKIYQKIKDNPGFWGFYHKGNEIQNMYIQGFFSEFIGEGKFTIEAIKKQIDCIEREKDKTDKIDMKDVMESEYEALGRGNGNDPLFTSCQMPLADKMQPYFSHCVAIRRLQEVQALTGFRRIFSSVPILQEGEPGKDPFEGYYGREDTNYEDHIPLFINELHPSWLPAITLRGEGIFITLNMDHLQQWEKECGDRYKIMGERLKAAHKDANRENFSSRYVLLHTLAHLLIREMVMECGYTEAAIKEKIYSTYPGRTDMAGILLYTSSSDSDGSLGGLVRLGQPDLFSRLVEHMVSHGRWCSNDPLCGESTAQGVDSLNYASCHACTLLPETSCEAFNSLLDRGAVVGIPHGIKGYFDGLL
jgi:DNA-directed RNA polymerase subunit RPC12/RpoP